MNQHGILSQQRLEADAISQGGGLEYVQSRQVGEQEVPDQRLPVINAPQKSRDALGVSASNQRWIFLRGGGDFRRLPTADQVEKALAHRSRLASLTRVGHRSGQNRLPSIPWAPNPAWSGWSRCGR